MIDGKKVNFFLVGDEEEIRKKEHIGGKNLIGDWTGKLYNKQKINKNLKKI